MTSPNLIMGAVGVYKQTYLVISPCSKISEPTGHSGPVLTFR